MQFFMSEGVSW